MVILFASLFMPLQGREMRRRSQEHTPIIRHLLLSFPLEPPAASSLPAKPHSLNRIFLACNSVFPDFYLSTNLLSFNNSLNLSPKMQFTTLLAGAAFVATALAQINIAFTSVPSAVVVGQQFNITWDGGDGVTVRTGSSSWDEMQL
jgi:hypothetical protein